MATYDLLLKQGTVVDGTGAPRFQADIGIKDGKIVKIGDITEDATELVDAAGMIVAPGFVDHHTHYDAQIFRDPTCADGGQNGVTTVVMTNCGFGFAPCRTEHQERYMIMMENVEQIPISHQKASLPWDWQSFPEFLTSLRSTDKAVNAMAYVPLNALLIFVMGIDAAKSRPATESEMAEIKQLLNEAMDAGALGFSCSYLEENNVHLDFDGSPMPCDVMDVDQLCEIGMVLKDRGDGIIQCLSGVPGMDDTIRASEQLARATGRPVFHNLIPTNDEVPVHKSGLSWLDSMREEGLDMWAASFCHRIWTEISLDTLTLFDSDDTFRELSYAPSNAKRLELLRDPVFRQRLRDAYDPIKFIAVGADLDRFVAVSVADSAEHKDVEGRILGEVAKETGMNIVDLFAELLLSSNGAAVLRSPFATASNPTILREIFMHERMIPGGSDGGAHLKIFSAGHWGTDFLVNLVRDQEIITLEEAHQKMSGLPMEVFGIADRGTIKEGMAADILVYDLDKLYSDTDAFRRAYDLPDNDWRKQVRAGGYDLVCVNGAITFRDGEHTGECPGKVVSQATG
tara:strand:+ start:4310 stop:6019 length:1710 start_codon:yes stop_codon:yes gene_type:complete